MNQYRFSFDQDGHTLDANLQPGPEHTLAVCLIKNPESGTAFGEAKAGALTALRRQAQSLAEHPEELRVVERRISRVEALDEGTADLLPDGENWL